jgi:hypothetical protein
MINERETPAPQGVTRGFVIGADRCPIGGKLFLPPAAGGEGEER